MTPAARVPLLALAATGLLAAAGLAWQAPAPDPAVTPAPAGGTRVPVLVELFTSEGCSSCPPADALLRDLIATQPVDAALVIGLSEHVDYWNRLGWADPFSDSAFSARQSAYAAAAQSNQVYTPQLVIDGRAAFVGSDRTRALAEIAAAAARPKAAITLNQAAAGQLHVRLIDGSVPPDTPIWMAIVEDGLSVQVKRGENADRTLSHDGVTHRLERVGRASRSGGFDKAVTVRLDASWNPDAIRIVVFAQAQGQPIAALGAMAVRGQAAGDGSLIR